MKSLGIDVGSTSVKIVMLDNNIKLWYEIVTHDGNISKVLNDIITKRQLNFDIKIMSTGGDGRNILNTEKIILPQSIEASLKNLNLSAKVVVSLGGETLVVYTVSDTQKVSTALMGDKCAAGTGEFMRQQLGRMNMSLSDLDNINENTEVHSISSRCSVFMKSDCTHKLNKNEATKEEIAVSLAYVMAEKVSEFLFRAKITEGNVVLIGGVSQNKFLYKFLKDKFKEITFIIPKEAPYFEALGAAYLAQNSTKFISDFNNIISYNYLSFEHYPTLNNFKDKVEYLQAKRGKIDINAEYVLGIDGGSTTTKAVLMNYHTNEIIATCYERTHGDPVNALRKVLIDIKQQIDNQELKITLISTTGSGREILGVFTETNGVYNEIIAHTEGTTHFKPEIDTIFEIGGQDAKYVYLRNGVPVDYAMNEACSAGTGSFLEESAKGDLDIQSAKEIGPLAMTSVSPLKFGEHCSAFINSDVRKAIQEGATKADIVAGIVFSIVSNYLNRVVGNRHIGANIVIQGGVAKNSAIPLAFAAILGKNILVPPDPELLGAFGVALLAIKKHKEGLLEKTEYSITELITREINYGNTFSCQACNNLCPIKTLKINGRIYAFGGRCAKYAISQKNNKRKLETTDNLVELRTNLLFNEYAPNQQNMQIKSSKIVGIPKAFTVHSMYPLYAWFFYELGIKTVLSDTHVKEGVRKAESAYCYPGEISHGMTEDLINKKVDYFFFPHVKNLESTENDVHATMCPITQGLPYYLRTAFGIKDKNILRPVIDFKEPDTHVQNSFAEMAIQLGFSLLDSQRAFNLALQKQKDYMIRLKQIGKKIIQEAKDNNEIIIALLGRSYNALTSDANMGIPQKFASRAYRIIPYDFLPISDEEITDNMYWYFGQLNLKSAKYVKDNQNLFICYVSNFGCAPDSFILHFLRYFMGIKPFLILELDSHTADAGLDTRIEAFLDIINGYKLKLSKNTDEPKHLKYSVSQIKNKTYVINSQTNEQINLNDKRVRIIVPSMGIMTTQAIAASIKHCGFNAEYMPVGDAQSTQLARSVASGKECIPTLIVLGQVLKLLLTNPPKSDEILVIVTPKTTGPCRTGQYGPFYEQIFIDLGLENICILYLNSDNSYKELGSSFAYITWHGIVASDFFKDMESVLKLTAVNTTEALKILNKCWEGVIDILGDQKSFLVIGYKLMKYLENIVPILQSIPINKKVGELPKVLIVGEIYVRRDEFSIQEVEEHLLVNGILAKTTGLSEWVSYCDYVREELATRDNKKIAFLNKPFSKKFRQFVKVKSEIYVQHLIEEKIRKILTKTNLLPEYPHDMNKIMSKVNDFTHIDFETEATISTLVAASAIDSGYNGILNIAPFACLPGRLIKAMLDPYCRERDMPFIALENDGLNYSQSIITRLEIFILNVLRNHQKQISKESLNDFVEVKSAVKVEQIFKEPLNINDLARSPKDIN